MFGVHKFSAVINPPQRAILAVGTTVQQAVAGADGTPRSVSTITLQLSYDRRTVDAQDAEQWLSAFQQLIESPDLMI